MLIFYANLRKHEILQKIDVFREKSRTFVLANM